MLAEQLEIATRQWTEDEFSFQGAHYQLDRCPSLPKPVQQPHPPVIIGGHGKPRSVALAARFAQEYNVFSVDLDECRTLRDRLDRACEAIGRDPATLPLSVTETTVIGPTPRELDRRLDDLASARARRPERRRADAATIAASGSPAPPTRCHSGCTGSPRWGLSG